MFGYKLISETYLKHLEDQKRRAQLAESDLFTETEKTRLLCESAEIRAQRVRQLVKALAEIKSHPDANDAIRKIADDAVFSNARYTQ